MRKKNLVGTLVVILVVFLGVKFFRSDDDVIVESPVVTPSVEVTAEKPAQVPVKSSVTKKATIAYTQTRVLENGRYVSTVSLTSTGFLPKVVEINKGETVRFVNKSGSAMRIASDDFGGTPLYVGLNQEKSVGQNGIYELTFTDTGAWAYHNRTAPSVIGVVYVK